MVELKFASDPPVSTLGSAGFPPRWPLSPGAGSVQVVLQPSAGTRAPMERGEVLHLSLLVLLTLSCKYTGIYSENTRRQ